MMIEKIKWGETLKAKLKARGKTADFSACKDEGITPIARSRNRTSTLTDSRTERVYAFPSIFPTPETETENQSHLCQLDIGSNKCFQMPYSGSYRLSVKFSNSSNGGTQCFPFYTYDEDGTQSPREHHRLGVGSIPLALRRRHAIDQVGHLPLCLWLAPPPGIPGAIPCQPQARPAAHPLRPGLLGPLPKPANAWQNSTSAMKPNPNIGSSSSKIQTRRSTGAWRKMRLSKDKTQIEYNDFLTLDGIPPESIMSIGSETARHSNGSSINTASRPTNEAA